MTDAPWPTNPYGSGSLPHPSWHAPRKLELDELLAALRDDKPVIWIRGARGIGKSSLVAAFAQAAREESRLVWIDVRDVVDPLLVRVPAAVLAGVARRWLQELRAADRLAADATIDLVPYETLVRLLPGLCAVDEPRLVLAVDELDYVGDGPRRELQALFTRSWSVLAPEPMRPPLLLAVQGRPWSEIAGPRDERVVTIDLGPLGEPAVAELLAALTARGWLPFDQTAARGAVELTGGYPLFLASLLDLLHAHRRRRGDRTALVSAEELRELAASASGVGLPPARIGHALEQAGLTARRVLKTLADVDRTGLSTLDALARVVAHEWDVPKAEVTRSLDGLLASGLIVDARAPRIAGELLGAWVRNAPMEEVLEGDTAAGPEALALLAQGEELERAGRVEEALSSFARALELTPGWFRAAWALGSLLLSRAREGDAHAASRAHSALESALAALPRTSQYVRRARRDLNEARVLAARHLPAGSQPRDAVLRALFRDDPELETAGAVEVATAHQVALWWRDIESLPPSRWRAVTLSALRQPRCRSGMAEHLAAKLEEATAAENWTRGSALVDQAAGLLAESQATAGVPAFWIAVVAFLDACRSQAITPDISITTLAALVREVDSDHRARLVRAGRPAARAAVLRAVKDPRARVGVLIQALEDAGDEEGLRAIAESLEETALGLSAASLDDAPVRVLARAVGAFSRSRWSTVRASAAEIAELLAEVPGSDDDKRPRIPVQKSDLEAWRHVAELGGARARALVERLEPVPDPEIPAELTEDDRADLTAMLGGDYDVVARLPLWSPYGSVEAVPSEVRAFKLQARAAPGEALLAYTYLLSGRSPASRELLRSVWTTHRRVVQHVGGLTDAIVRLRHEATAKEPPRGLIVTEWPGDETLRERLRRGAACGDWPTRGKDRAALWRHAAALIEAVQILHRLGFLHRSIRPECIFVRSDEDLTARAGRPALVLGRFEWSVWLRDIAAARPLDLARDRYAAPEALRSLHRRDDKKPRGETFASDRYGLGLVLFECFVRPLTSAELGHYELPDSYGEEAQREHAAWIEGLRKEIPTSFSARERDILLSLLAFEIEDRPRDLDEVLLHARSLGQLTVSRRRDADPICLFTTLGRNGHENVLDDDWSIARYARPGLPALAARDPAAPLDRQTLRDLLRDELRGPVDVFANRGSSDFPLLFETRSGFRLRVGTFCWNGISYPNAGYAQATRHSDVPCGAPLARLQGFELRNVLPDEVDLDRVTRPTVLAELLASAGAAHRRGDYSVAAVLHIDTHLQHEMASAEVAVVASEPSPSYSDDLPRDTPARHRGVALRGKDPRVNLAAVVERWICDDPVVELGSSGTRAGQGRRLALSQEDLDLDAGVVIVRLEMGDIMPAAVLRPSIARAAEALRRRRESILGEIRDDTFLLRALAEPAAASYAVPEAYRADAMLQADLDADKRDAVRRFATTRPLLAVQGPPGTGKTSLAAELVLQTLSRDPSARVLVTTQSHEPLDNLLERLHLVLERNQSARAAVGGPVLVRAPAIGHRPPTGSIAAAHRPADRAELLFASMRRWIEARAEQAAILPRRLARSLRDRLAQHPTAPDTLRERLERAANVLFATTNSREIADALPASFDLVIVEEAARSYPVEIAGALRLARRWVLIGDHQQLPPHGHLDYLARAEHVFREADDEDRRELGPATRTLVDSVPDLAAAFRRIWRVFSHVHGGLAEGEGPEERRPSMTLVTQWRMHPALGDVVSKVFYDGGSVKSPRGADRADLARKREHGLRLDGQTLEERLIWVDFPAASEDPSCAESWTGAGLHNVMERYALVATLRRLSGHRYRSSDVAILSPYRRQVEELRGVLEKNSFSFLGGTEETLGQLSDRVFTVDSFQGRQAPIVLVSLVRNNDRTTLRQAVGFLSQRERGTVMFSRAERLLIVFGSSKHFARFTDGPTGTGWMMRVHDEAKHIDYRDLLADEHRGRAEERHDRTRGS